MKLHFVRSIRGLQNFLAIPIMNTLAGFMICIAFSLLIKVVLLNRTLHSTLITSEVIKCYITFHIAILHKTPVF